jgi:hypothetical protein
MMWRKGDVREIKKGHEGVPNLVLVLCESSLSQMLALIGNSLGSRLSISFYQ